MREFGGDRGRGGGHTYQYEWINRKPVACNLYSTRSNWSRLRRSRCWNCPALRRFGVITAMRMEAIEFILDYADGRLYRIWQYGLEAVNPHMLADRRRKIAVSDALAVPMSVSRRIMECVV